MIGGVNMSKLFCEVYIKDIMPAIRALIAKDLVTRHGISQWSAAKALNITQASINYYLTGQRGFKMISRLSRSEEIIRMIREASDSIIRGDFDYLFFCRICTYIRSNNEVLKKIGLDKESYIHPKCPTDIS
jgi:predicted transcriptional regulator